MWGMVSSICGSFLGERKLQSVSLSGSPPLSVLVLAVFVDSLVGLEEVLFRSSVDGPLLGPCWCVLY